MIKDYFTKNCISVRAWAKKHDLELFTLYKVINGDLTGEKNTKGNTKKVFEVLYSEGIIKELPIGLRNDKEKAS